MKAAKQKSVLDRVRRPAGRVDLLVGRVIGEAVKQHASPASQVVYQAVRTEVDQLIHQVLGPKTRAGRQLKEILAAGRELAGTISPGGIQL